MTDPSTVKLRPSSEQVDASASGSWSESFQKRPEARRGILRVGQVAGIILALATSPATAVPDIWYLQRRKRDVTTAVYVFQVMVGRPISRIEALEIAQHILERAERERLETAEFEAARGIRWEDEA